MESTIKQETTVCRGCLSTGLKMVNATLFGDMFRELTGIDISSSDGLPQSLCYICSALLQKCVNFRSKIIKSHELLCEYVHKNIPFANDEIVTPHLSWTTIMYNEYSDAQDKQVQEQVIYDPVDIARPVITNVESVQPNEESTSHNYKDDITHQDFCYEVPVIDSSNGSSLASDKHKVYYVVTSNKQTEQLEINPGKEKNTVVDDTGTPVMKALIVNGKVQIVGADQRIGNEDAYVREGACLATHERDADDTSVNSSSCNTEQSYTCDSCNISFKKKEHIIFHIQTLKCDLCMKCFSGKNQLNRHYLIHTREKLYQCNKCMRTFKSNRLLKIHERTHTNNRPYQCDVCKKDFKNRQVLAAHYRIHTGEKPYQCDVCMRSFNQKCTLTIHYRLHTGEKPYKCEVCGKTFRSKNNLRKHSPLHDKNPYKCDLCPRCFKVESALTVHQRKYHCK